MPALELVHAFEVRRSLFGLCASSTRKQCLSPRSQRPDAHAADTIYCGHAWPVGRTHLHTVRLYAHHRLPT